MKKRGKYMGKMKLMKWFLVLLFSFTPLLGENSYTLEQLINLALKRNPLLHSFNQKERQIINESRVVSSLPEPRLGVSQFLLPIYTGQGTQGNIFSISQNIPFPGKLSLKEEIILKNSEIISLRREALKRDLVWQIKTLYYQTTGIEEKVNQLLEYQDLLKSFKNIAETRYETGVEKLGTILKVDIEINGVDERIADLRTKEATLLEEIKRLINLSDEGFGIRYENVLNVPELETERLMADARERNQELRELRLRSRQSGLKKKLARMNYLPDFSVSSSYFRITPEGGKEGKDALNLTLGLKLPFWIEKNRRSVEQYRAEYRSLEFQLQDLENRIKSGINSNLEKVSNYNRILQLLDESIIPRARDMVNSILANYKTGRMSFLDLLDAERMVLKYSLERIEIQTNLQIALADLERLTGGNKDYLK